MNLTTRLLGTTLTLLAIAAPAHADVKPLNCTVDVNYRLIRLGQPGNAQTYSRAFTITPDTPYYEDFSTALRIRDFFASMTPGAGATEVDIRYFSDVSVVVSVDFNARLTMAHNQKEGTISGTHGFSSSQGVAGTHETSYTLTCLR